MAIALFVTIFAGLLALLTMQARTRSIATGSPRLVRYLQDAHEHYRVEGEPRH